MSSWLFRQGRVRRCGSTTTPPAQLTLYQTNSQNELLNTVQGGSTGATQAIATYSYDRTGLELNDAYNFDLTQYVNLVIRRQITNRPLLLSVPLGQNNLQSLLRRVSVGD